MQVHKAAHIGADNIINFFAQAHLKFSGQPLQYLSVQTLRQKTASKAATGFYIFHFY